MLNKYVNLLIFLITFITLFISFISPNFNYDLNEIEYINVTLNEEKIKIKNGSTFKDLLIQSGFNINDQYNIALDYVLKDNEVINLKEIDNQNKISINNATIDELIKLPGIGEAIANRIIEYRNNYGEFKHIEELKFVKGIGDKKYEKIKELITI